MGLSINNKTFPEVVQLLHRPEHRGRADPDLPPISSNGSEIGSLTHLPPTLTLQYHFNPTGTIRPYAGMPAVRRPANSWSARPWPAWASAGASEPPEAAAADARARPYAHVNERFT